LCREQGKVRLIGSGSFDTVGGAARTGVNPQSCGKTKIKATTSVKFKAGAPFREKVNTKPKAAKKSKKK
jgi:DNA-binding protein HU-beta